MWAWDIWFSDWAWYRKVRGGDWRYGKHWRDTCKAKWRRFPEEETR